MEGSDPLPAVAPPRGGRPVLRDAILLAALSGLLYTLALGLSPTHRIQEVRVLETAREMQASGDWTVPRYLDEPRLVKFPLAYWLCMAGYALTGRADEFSGRLFSAAAGVLTVLLAYALGLRIASRRMAFWTGFMLATSPLFFRFSRYAETDLLMTCGITASLYAFLRAFEDAAAPAARRRLWTILAWGAMGIACLAKGPAGIAMPLIVAAFHLTLARRWRDLPRLFHPAGVALFLLLVAPWPLLVWSRMGNDFFSVIGKEADSALGGQKHGRDFLDGILFYPRKTASDFAPWWVLFTVGLLAVTTGGLRRSPRIAFPLVWAGTMLLQLLFVGNKQTHYILPAYPAMAALAAWWAIEEGFQVGSRGRPVRLVPERPARCILPIAAGALLIALPLWIFLGDALEKDKEDLCRDFARAAAPLVEGRPLHLHGDTVPEVVFYLGRPIPRIPPGPEGIDGLLRGQADFRILARRESRNGIPGHDAALEADPRLRVVLESPPGQLPLRLYGPASSSPPAAPK